MCVCVCVGHESASFKLKVSEAYLVCSVVLESILHDMRRHFSNLFFPILL